tara:strand:- start:772 stop:1068 length:297 start_codon:yes stop_codon:yes gene_type:complete
MELTSKQRKYLRSKAHHLKPVVVIGKANFSQSVIKTVDSCLKSHELIKIRFSQHKDQKLEIIDKINSAIDSHIVGSIGNIVIIFRQNLDLDKRIYKID